MLVVIFISILVEDESATGDGSQSDRPSRRVLLVGVPNTKKKKKKEKRERTQVFHALGTGSRDKA